MADEPPVTLLEDQSRQVKSRARREPKTAVPPQPTLRDRLIAALRPRMTAIEAEMAVDQLLADVYAYGLECAQTALADQAATVAQMVTLAQDCLDIVTAGP